MRTRIALVVVVVIGAAFAYLAARQPLIVPLSLGGAWQVEVSLGTIVFLAFVTGGGLAGILLWPASSRRAPLPPPAPPREEPAAAYARGLDDQRAGRVGAAEEAYRDVLRRTPGFAAAHARLGEVARVRGDAPAALHHALQALRADETQDARLVVAEAYRRAGRPADAVRAYEEVLARDATHLTALRGLRDAAAGQGHWARALEAQERVVALLEPAGRATGADGARAGQVQGAEEQAWLAGLHYEIGQAHLRAGDAGSAVVALREALRARPDFVPAALALGDAHLKAGDTEQAREVWERAIEGEPALPLLARVEYLHREAGRPTRMIALYQRAAARAPDNLALAVALGRVYFELSMLDEAAEEFQKVEVRAPDLPPLHAYLGIIYERRERMDLACEEYRRVCALTASFDWPHRCAGCGAREPRWTDRCPACRRWNTFRP